MVFSDRFAESPEKNAQWSALIRKRHLDYAPKELVEVLSVLRTFLLPIAQAVREKRSVRLVWTAPGPWRPKP